MDNKEVNVKALLDSGLHISFIKGRFFIVDRQNGEPELVEWASKNQRDIVRDVLKKLEVEALIYTGYGSGLQDQKLEGVHLQFESINGPHLSYYCIYNAYVRYERGPKKGSVLPKGQFKVGRKSEFRKFWYRLDLSEPRGRAGYCKSMGQLKHLYFCADIDSGEKIEKRTLQGLNIPYEKICEAYQYPTVEDKFDTREGQSRNNSGTAIMHNESDQRQEWRAVQGSRSTGDGTYGIRLKGSAVQGTSISESNGLCKPPQEQTVQEWLDDHEQA
ncbi:MAG: hypothetical protein HWE12_12920 [Oceanospirillaceae bacterium]|nr:hypothetical protein [Oceanospirillaceae bacterium]